ncbi:hypothetical protein FH972_024145 [Carpinus fangiana]|uniref:Aminoglycoside phosphotransferase domain-containing protein n=1 Tax=Carpinus fangiana TaxID=176857 RepID=A0A5N6KX64_9ROSI|nr:hypothetical protein FH972_024145 [Carpinus fangiana]
MPLRNCDYEACARPVERNAGNCTICGSHRCYEHLELPFHSCPPELGGSEEFFDLLDQAEAKRLDELLQRINADALRAIASKLRANVPCTIPQLGKAIAAQRGGPNCHADICFEDGVTWIARIRLDDPHLAPAQCRDYISQSEVATYKFLESTAVPAPRVHHFVLSDKLDDVGVPYIFMDKVPGHVLQWNSATSFQKTKVMTQLADIFLELRQHPFPKCGSLDLKSTKSVGPFAQPQLFKNPTQALGPFGTTHEMAQRILLSYLDMYHTGELKDYTTDSTLTHKWRLDNLDLIYPPEQGDRFFLKHFEDKGDHILVNDEFDITGIIDWEWASIENEHLAFSSPCMMWPVGDFYRGQNNLTKEEKKFAEILKKKGDGDMHSLVMNGRLYQRILFFIGGSPGDHDTLVYLFDGLRKALRAADQHDEDTESYEEWKQAAIVRYSRE